MKSFADRLMDAIDCKHAPSCIGLDPRLEQMPNHIRHDAVKKYGETFEAVAACFFEFNKAIIDSVKDQVPAVKPQMAFYEAYGSPGVKAFKDTVDYAKKHGLLVIEDAKRGDIGSSSEAYSSGHIGKVEFWGSRKECYDVDAITVNPYLGSDGVMPFVKDCIRYGKGIFVLVKTSNPSSGQLQDAPSILGHPQLEKLQKKVVESGSMHLSDVSTTPSDANNAQIGPNYLRVARLVREWGVEAVGKRGYSSVGAVVGATYPNEARILREAIPTSFFLVPGYGAQGGSADDAMPCFNSDGYGAVVSSSRGVIFAYLTEPYKKLHSDTEFDVAASKAAALMREELDAAMKKAGKYPW